MPAVAADLDEALADKVLAGERITPDDARALYRLPLNELGSLADHRRNLMKGESYGGRGNEIVTYIIDRNINYTNVCNVYCCLLYTSPSPRDRQKSRMPSSA